MLWTYLFGTKEYLTQNLVLDVGRQNLERVTLVLRLDGGRDSKGDKETGVV